MDATATRLRIGGAKPAGVLNLATATVWAFGGALLVVAAALPFAHRYLYVAPFKSELAAAADHIIEGQRNELVRRERFAPAKAGVFAASNDRIAAEARVLADGRLLVRVMTAPEAVSQAWMPALIYQKFVDINGEATEGTWLSAD